MEVQLLTTLSEDNRTKILDMAYAEASKNYGDNSVIFTIMNDLETILANSDSRYIIATTDQTVGTAVYIERTKYIYLEHFVCQKDSSKVLQQLYNHHNKPIFAITHKTNSKGRQLYQKYGFSECSKLPEFLENEKDILLDGEKYTPGEEWIGLLYPGELI